VPAGHPDFFALSAVNHPLGGAFTSRLNLNLRERRGWTYGVRSGFSGGAGAGWFQVATAVETGVTAPAIEEIVREIAEFRAGGVAADEADLTRASLARTLLRQYEPAEAKASFAANVVKYNWPRDYPARRLAWLESMDASDLDALARRYIDVSSLHVVCVGDAALLEPSLEGLGLGEVVRRVPV
jgi:zinc protease